MTATLHPPGAVQPEELAPSGNPHRALVRYLVGRRNPGYEPLPVERHPRLTSWVDVVGLGVVLGATIGAITGAAVAVWFFVTGAIYGAPIGGVLGALIGLPASIVLTVVLLAGPRHDPYANRRRTAATLAVLFELLVAVELVGAVVVGANAYEGGGLLFVLLSGAILVYGWLDLALLRWATGHLADAFSSSWGWRRT